MNKKLIMNKLFNYGKLVMTASRTRFFFITISCVAVIIAVIETNKALFFKNKEEFYKANILFTAIFTIEFILRFLSCEKEKLGKRKFVRLHYMLKPTAIIDIITIVPFYLYFFYPSNILFKTLRIFRILNLIQFSKFDRLLNKISRFIKQRKTAIIASLLIAVIFILIIATLMFLVEGKVQPNNFGSVYQSLWWSIVTVTAVGYGDVVPHTTLGKIIGSITCFSGILFIVIPVSIFSSELAKIRFSTKKYKLLKNGKKRRFRQ